MAWPDFWGCPAARKTLSDKNGPRKYYTLSYSLELSYIASTTCVQYKSGIRQNPDRDSNFQQITDTMTYLAPLLPFHRWLKNILGKGKFARGLYKKMVSNQQQF